MIGQGERFGEHQRDRCSPGWRRSRVAKERVERDEEDLVRLYLTDIGQYPLLTKEGEVRLAQQIEAGVEARTALAETGRFPDAGP
jgi:Sigma-70 factor, region 1.